MADEGFASPTNINWQGHTGIAEYGGGDSKMVVMFYNKPVHNPAKSVEAGCPIYEDVVYVRIHPPGERLNIVDTPANTGHYRRFPMQWHQFQQQKQQIPEGTPIDLLYPEQPSIGATLRASSVHTIEQCAELSAHAIETIGMGAQTYVNAAQKYLTAANKGASQAQFRRELEVRDQQIKILTRQVEQLKSSLEEFSSNRINQSVSADQLQALIAAAMGRPQHMPRTTFDPAMAQLNATHGSNTRAQPSRPGRRVRATLD